MNVSSLGYRTDLMVRRLAGSTVEDGAAYVTVRTPSNPTFWWGNFLLFPGALRRGDSDKWSALFAAALPEAQHRAYGVDGTMGELGEEAELAALGVSPDVSIVLTATVLREPQRPAAVCRPLNGDDDWDQALQLRLACDDQAGDAAHRIFLRRKRDEARDLVERGHGAWFGAFVDGRMVSGLGVISDRLGLARYQGVETDPSHRRRGLAARLLYEGSRYAAEQLAAHTLVIVADPGYHAIDLYRSLGFTDTEWQVQLVAANQ